MVSLLHVPLTPVGCQWGFAGFEHCLTITSRTVFSHVRAADAQTCPQALAAEVRHHIKPSDSPLLLNFWIC